ncbi:MAG: hypothetical protein JRH20_15100 [Deltaproteobacteria bacterium]|nr:hypothetical protein [Deltaproteobacteria bacterium]
MSFAGPAGHREDATYGRGEELVSLLSVSGFVYEAGKVDLKCDLEVVDARGRKMAESRGLVLLVGKAPTSTPGEVRVAAKLPLSPALPAGNYTLRVGVTDHLGKRFGKAEGAFRLAGPTLPTAEGLALLTLRIVGDQASPAGSVIPLSLVVAGFETRPRPRGHRVELDMRTTLVDASGKTRAQHHARLLRVTLPFAARSLPGKYGLALPKTLEPGRYTAHLALEDLLANKNAKASLKVEVLPPKLGIYNLHLFDASRLARESFRFGEQIFVRFALHGFSVKDARANLAVDLAISGLGGVYLSRTDAARTEGVRSATWARSGRFPRQVSLVLPALAPAGRYTLLVRARDVFAKKEVTRELAFRLEGKAPPPLPFFKVDRFDARLRPDLPPVPGDAFIRGQAYHLTVRTGGGKLKAKKKLTYEVQLQGDLQLLNVVGRVVKRWPKLFQLERTLHHQPLRLISSAHWTPPKDLPPGLYDLEVRMLSVKRDRVSTLRRRVELR